MAPVTAANKAGDAIQAAKLLIQAVYQLPPGGFDSFPQIGNDGARQRTDDAADIRRSGTAGHHV